MAGSHQAGASVDGIVELRRGADAVLDVSPFCKAVESGPVKQTTLKDTVLKWRGDKFFPALQAAKDAGALTQYKDKNPVTGRQVFHLALPEDAPILESDQE